MRPRLLLLVISAGLGCVVAACDSSLSPEQVEASLLVTPVSPGLANHLQLDPLLEGSAGPRAVVAGDINNDGLTDLASVWSENQPVQIHLRRAGVLAFDTITIAGGAPVAQALDLELADLNADGKLDIIVLVYETGFCGGALVILIQGDDPREPSEWWQVPAAGRVPPDNLSFPAGGARSAGPPPGCSTATPDAGVSDLEVANLDGDNYPDVVVLATTADPGNNTVHLFPNPGPAAVGDQAAWVSTVIEHDSPAMGKTKAADLDLDGDLDLVLSAPTGLSFNLRWLQNPLIKQQTTTPNPVPTFFADLLDPVFEATAGAQATVTGDIDRDGLTDVVSVSDESQPVQVHFRNAGTGHFDTLSIAGGAPLTRMNDVELADFNADGKLDVAVLVNDTGYVPPPPFVKIGAFVLLIQGNNARQPSDWTRVDATRTPLPTDMIFYNNEASLADLAISDFNRDALPDIVLTSNEYIGPGDSNYCYLFLNPGAADSDDPTRWNRTVIDTSVADMGRLAVTDLDLDGLDDVVMAVPQATSFNLRWLDNGSNGLAWTTRLVGQQDLGADFMVLGDIDGDGDVDVAAASVLDSLTQWFRNPGPAALTPAAAQVPWEVFNIGTTDQGQINQIQLVDLDDNGTLDCFVSTTDTHAVGTGFRRQDNMEHLWDSFPICESTPGDEAAIGRVAFSDFDGDGKLDFAAPFNRPGLLDDHFVLYKSMAASLWLRRIVGQQDGGANALAVGDIDRDGDIDIAAAHYAQCLVQWFRNPGSQALLPTAAQVPWYAFTLADLAHEDVNGTTVTEIERLELVDLDGDGILECFASGSGTAFVAVQPGNAWETWDASAIFTTYPLAEIGRATFTGLLGGTLLDFVVPLDRDGPTQDQIIIFPGTLR